MHLAGLSQGWAVATFPLRPQTSAFSHSWAPGGSRQTLPGFAHGAGTSSGLPGHGTGTEMARPAAGTSTHCTVSVLCARRGRGDGGDSAQPKPTPLHAACRLLATFLQPCGHTTPFTSHDGWQGATGKRRVWHMHSGCTSGLIYGAQKPRRHRRRPQAAVRQRPAQESRWLVARRARGPPLGPGGAGVTVAPEPSTPASFSARLAASCISLSSRGNRESVTFFPLKNSPLSRVSGSRASR